MDDIPFVALGNDEIEEAPELADEVTCRNCGEEHEVQLGKDESGQESDKLQFISCPDGPTYLVGVDGKDIRGSFE